MMGNNSLMQYANYLIIFSVCIDKGDGRWKERDKKNLEHDITVYKKMAEKLEHEIENFYEEYPDGWLGGDNIGRTHYKYLTNLLNRDIGTTKGSENKDKEKHNFSTDTRGVTAHEQETNENSNTFSQSQFMNDNYSDSELKSSDWPKFDVMLLEIGLKYDWKNDRWIKVKVKPKITKNNDVLGVKNDRVDIHEKHKFNYRSVKLNKRKSRRNVVVAVSAVR